MLAELKKSALTDENSAFENDRPPDTSLRRFSAVGAENPIRPLDDCAYETFSLILLADFAYPDFVILLLVYGSLPFSPYSCTLIKSDALSRFSCVDTMPQFKQPMGWAGV